MKHPLHITKSYTSVSYEEIRPLVERLAQKLSSLGISASVNAEPEELFKGFLVKFSFCKHVTGRHYVTRSLVDCSGFSVSISKCRGQDEELDGNGRFVWDEENKCVKCTGPEYDQWQAYFRFAGKERGYRCKKFCCIQPKLPFDYGDELSDIDFSESLDWLSEVW